MCCIIIYHYTCSISINWLFFFTPTALTYNSDVYGSPEDPVVCGSSVTEIHSAVKLVDLAELQPPAVLTGGSALRGHSFDTLEGETRHFISNWFAYLQSGSARSHTRHLLLHLVPDDVCVVAAVQTWTGNLPFFIHRQIFHAVFKLEASQTFPLQHLQVEGPVPAAGPQKNMTLSPHMIELIIYLKILLACM